MPVCLFVIHTNKISLHSLLLYSTIHFNIAVNVPVVAAPPHTAGNQFYQALAWIRLGTERNRNIIHNEGGLE